MISACPYCRSPFEEGDEITICEVCSTPHHADCYAENAGCTVFGCSKAPSDEPKISVSASDLTATLSTGASGSSVRPTPPPPPRPGATTSVPPPNPMFFREDTTRYITPPRSLEFAGYNTPPPPAIIPAYIPRRSRLTYILLGVLLGAFGGHNFYAGYVKRAVIQLLLTVLSCFFGGIISWVWALVEIFTVRQDSDGVAFI